MEIDDLPVVDGAVRENLILRTEENDWIPLSRISDRSQTIDMAHRAVFLDRDGTINEEMGYVNHLERFRLLPRAGKAIRLLNQNGIKAVVVTNQAGVARGYFPESLIHLVHRKMEDLFKRGRSPS